MNAFMSVQTVFTEGGSILYHVSKAASNCILNIKVKNINSITVHSQSKEPGRKILKLSSKYRVYVFSDKF